MAAGATSSNPAGLSPSPPVKWLRATRPCTNLRDSPSSRGVEGDPARPSVGSVSTCSSLSLGVQPLMFCWPLPTVECTPGKQWVCKCISEIHAKAKCLGNFPVACPGKGAPPLIAARQLANSGGKNPAKIRYPSTAQFILAERRVDCSPRIVWANEQLLASSQVKFMTQLDAHVNGNTTRGMHAWDRQKHEFFQTSSTPKV